MLCDRDDITDHTGLRLKDVQAQTSAAQPFTDPHFPPNDTSLGKVVKTVREIPHFVDNSITRIQWTRVGDMCAHYGIKDLFPTKVWSAWPWCLSLCSWPRCAVEHPLPKALPLAFAFLEKSGGELSAVPTPV